MTLKRVPSIEEKGYEGYRFIRTKYLETYAILMLRKFHYLKRIIGIATEPPGRRKGSSEDIIYVEQQDWNEKTIADAEETAAHWESCVH
jgi:hypothetical protein